MGSFSGRGRRWCCQGSSVTDGWTGSAAGRRAGDLDRLDALLVRQLEAEDLGVEAQLAIQGPADVLGPAKAMLLAFEGQVGDGHPLLLEGIDDHRGLVGGDDLILEPLEDDQR